MTEGIAEIIDIETVALNTKKIILSKPEKFTFQAGQFLLIKFEKKLMRAYSIASPPSEKNLELVIRIVPNGKGSAIIDAAKIGDKFTLAGGMGHFILSNNSDAELIFCATGTGIAPFKSMIKTESTKKNPRKMMLLYGGRKKEDLSYLNEISSWGENINVKIGFSEELNASEIVIENLEAKIASGRITQFIEKTNYSNLAEFYICGNNGMVSGTKDLLIEKGIKKEQIFFEKFS